MLSRIFSSSSMFCHFLKVVFNQRQISMFSYEQAAAVTKEQLTALSDVQKTALAMVLTPWEDKPVDFRGKPLKSLTVCFIFKNLIVNRFSLSELTSQSSN